jgi:uroporphyrinogen-III synthase
VPSKSVFISRDLEPDSVFLQRLRAAGFIVAGQSLVQITPLPFGPVPACDWIFFSSRHAVRCFFHPAPGSSGRPPGPDSDVRYAALGSGTAAALAAFVPAIHFTGNGEAVKTVRTFLPVAAGMRILFPCARYSRRSVQKAIGHAATLIDLIVYDNQALPDPPLRNESILVFTSPLNARAYYGRHAVRPDQRAVAIGAPTAAAMREAGVADVVIAAQAGEAQLAETVLALSD